MAQVSMFSDEWLSRYGLLENFNTRIVIFEGVLDLKPPAPPPGLDLGARYHGMKAYPTGYLWSKYDCFLMSGGKDMDF